MKGTKAEVDFRREFIDTFPEDNFSAIRKKEKRVRGAERKSISFAFSSSLKFLLCVYVFFMSVGMCDLYTMILCTSL